LDRKKDQQDDYYFHYYSLGWGVLAIIA